MNSIVRVGDGDGLYREQWNFSGDRRMSIDYFYFFTKYIALLSLIVKKWSLHIYHIIWRIYCRFVRFCMTFLIYGCKPFSFIDLFPPYFIKLCQNIHPKTPLKCDFSIWAGPNTFTFWSANFQIKLPSPTRTIEFIDFYLYWDIFHCFYFFTKYIAFLSLIVKKWSLHISYNMKNISLSFLFYRLIPFLYFIKLCQNIHPKTPLKCDFFCMSRAKYVHFLVCKLGPFQQYFKKGRLFQIFFLNLLLTKSSRWQYNGIKW
jgi:hypothetical protein